MESPKFQKEIDFYKQNGYVVFKKHLNPEQCDLLTKTAMETLFNLAFFAEVEPVPPTFENLKLFVSRPEREARLAKPHNIWVNGRSVQPLCSRSTGLCYGSYLKPVQSTFTMTYETFEKIAACYGDNNIAQIYGPKRYTIRLKGGTESIRQVPANLISDFNNVAEEVVHASVVVSVDETIEAGESGSICLVPGFNLYRKHAQKFFSPVGGYFKLPLNLEIPMQFPNDLAEEGMIAFNTFLKELHDIRDGNMKPDEQHEKYLELELPKERVELKWTFVKLERGDMICRSQWMPFYETECKSVIPFIAFHVGYYKIPPDFPGSFKQRILTEALENGHVLEDCKDYSNVKYNTCEVNMLKKTMKPEDTFFYAPENADEDELAFVLFIQCIHFG